MLLRVSACNLAGEAEVDMLQWLGRHPAMNKCSLFSKSTTLRLMCECCALPSTALKIFNFYTEVSWASPCNEPHIPCSYAEANEDLCFAVARSHPWR